MNLVTSFQNFATRVGQEFKSVRTLLNNNAPDLKDLGTTAKGSIVAAINELHQADITLRDTLLTAIATKADADSVHSQLVAQNELALSEIATAINTQLGDPNVDLIASFDAALV